jgi:hypothetical protein
MKMRGVRMHRGGALAGTEVRGIDRMRKPTPSRGFRRGIAIVWTAIILVLMLGFVGLSLDWGKAAIDAHQLQNAADAAALAGAQKLKEAYHESTMDAPDGPFGRARAVALENRAWGGTPVNLHYVSPTAYDPTVDVVIGRFFPADKHFEPFNPAAPESPNALKAVTRHLTDWPVNAPLPLTFGPVFGQDRANVIRVAIAINVGGGGAALICLDPTNPGIRIDGGAKLYVNAGTVPGEIYVDSGKIAYAVYPTSNSAPSMEDGWCIDCAALNVCGRVDPIITDYFGLGGTGAQPGYARYPIVEGAPPMLDPLKDLPAVDPGALGHGVVVQVDPATGVPLRDPTTGAYVPALGKVGGPYEGQPFDVDRGDPITGTIVDNYGAADPVTGRLTVVMTPGYYPGGIRLTSSSSTNRTVKMLPGIYALGGGRTNGDGAGLVLNGGAIEAESVMTYITQSDQGTSPWGKVDISGSYDYIKMTEYVWQAGDPLAYQAYSQPPMGAGMAIFQDRHNPEDATVRGGGAGYSMTLGGTIYIHNIDTWDIQVNVGGSSGDTGIQLITDRVRILGDANITIKYDGRNFQPADQSLLVK